MSIRTITVKDHKELNAILKSLGYKKRTAHVRVGESVELIGTYWDGGSRSQYTTVKLDGFNGFQRALPQYGPFEKTTHTAPVNPGYLIVETGVFCGKPATACITIHPVDQTRFGL